jgi:hypothetical protein
MQRENNFLRSSTRKSSKQNFRSAMAMMMAIITLVVISTIMALSLSMTAETSKKSINLYLHEQAQLLTQSATEYTLLKIAKNAPCTNLNENISKQDGIYDINISISYIYTSEVPCLENPNRGTLYTTISTPEQNGSALIDVTVSVTDKNISTEPIRVFRRTIQKL